MSLAVGALLPTRLAAEVAADVLLEGSVLLGMTWLVARVLAERSPAERHALWTTGFVLALLVPLGGRLLPQHSLGLVTLPGSPAETGTGWAATGFLVLWCAGALVLLVRLGSHRIRVGRLTSRGRTADPGDLPARIARREARRMGIARRVDVIYTGELRLPVTWGVLRPVLLLPPEARAWTETRLRAVTVHELAHVRRWDALSQQLAEVVRALYWTNPLVWTARRRASRERESACDEEVLRRGMASAEYAGILMEMAGRPGPVAAAEPEEGLALAAPSRLESRIAAVLEGRVAGRSVGAGGGALVSCLVLVLLSAPLAVSSPVTPAPSRAPAVGTRLRGLTAPPPGADPGRSPCARPGEPSRDRPGWRGPPRHRRRHRPRHP